MSTTSNNQFPEINNSRETTEDSIINLTDQMKQQLIFHKAPSVATAKRVVFASQQQLHE